MTPEQALAFVAEHGVVLASARGGAPSLVEAIAGEPIRGGWWAHPNGRAIYTVLQSVQDAPDILVCRALAGKITLVHRRLWPALVRLSDRFPVEHLAQIHQEHTASGRHLNRAVAFPHWVPAEVSEVARGLAEDEASRALGDWVPRK